MLTHHPLPPPLSSVPLPAAAACQSLERVIHLCSAGGGRDGKTALSIAVQGGHVKVVVHLLGALRQELALALAHFRFFLLAAKFAGNAPEVAPGNRCVVSKLGMSLGIYHLANINKLIADYVGVLRTGGAAERALAALAADAAARLSGTMPSPWGGAPRKAPPLLCAAAEMGRVDVVKVLLKAAEGGQAAATVKCSGQARKNTPPISHYGNLLSLVNLHGRRHGVKVVRAGTASV